MSKTPRLNIATATTDGQVHGGTVPGKIDGTVIVTGYIGEVISGTVTGAALTGASTAYASVTLNAGIWRITYEATLQPIVAAVANNESFSGCRIYNVTDAVNLAGTDRSIYVRNFTAISAYNIGCVTASTEVSITSSKTYALHAYFANVVGTNNGSLLNQATYHSRFYATRIG